MHYLSLALYAEGPADYNFLRPLLQRLCEALCQEANQPVEFPESVLALDHPQAMHNAPRDERIAAAAREARGAWRILFVHADADGDAGRARAERAQPGIDRLHQEFGGEGIGVAVIPVRETEAWAIADGDALRRASGSSASDQHMGLPPTRAIESESDPKAVLDQAWRIATASRKRQRSNPAGMLSYLGETISLDRLRSLSAFQTLERDVKAALHALHIIS